MIIIDSNINEIKWGGTKQNLVNDLVLLLMKFKELSKIDEASAERISQVITPLFNGENISDKTKIFQETQRKEVTDLLYKNCGIRRIQ